MGPTFSTTLNEFWTDFLQFLAKDGGCRTPAHPPNVRPCVNGALVFLAICMKLCNGVEINPYESK